jgi:hypothetical protein
VTTYYAETPVDGDTANAVIAEVGRIAASTSDTP